MQTQNWLTERTESPKTFKRSFKDPWKMLSLYLYLMAIFFPTIICSIFEYIVKRPKSVEGKIALITGSGRGLGRGLAIKFADLGCKVVCVDIDEETNIETQNIINAQYHPNTAKAYTCNIAKVNQIQELKRKVIQDFGRVDILVNNAGMLIGCTIMEMDHDYAETMIDINLLSHVIIIREFLPDMVTRNDGHLVCISSCAGLVGVSGFPLYCATKHALIGLMEGIDSELSDKKDNKVKTTNVLPYFINTSPYYTQFWDLRFPELTINDAVDAILNGVLKDRRILTIPGFLFYALLILRMLPYRLKKIARKVVCVNLTSVPWTFQKEVPFCKKLISSQRNS